ncbi:MAG: hypothetical protein ABSG54_04340 [Terriglobia bacterium]
MFSRLAQAGARSLHHWGFHADQQYGEVDGGTAQPYLSYWVDYWLGRYFPSPPGSDVLQLDASDNATVEILDARTDPAVRPDPQPITPAQQMEITLPGYGVTFLELK